MSQKLIEKHVHAVTGVITETYLNDDGTTDQFETDVYGRMQTYSHNKPVAVACGQGLAAGGESLPAPHPEAAEGSGIAESDQAEDARAPGAPVDTAVAAGE